jgi:hypothetical protein
MLPSGRVYIWFPPFEKQGRGDSRRFLLLVRSIINKDGYGKIAGRHTGRE